MDSLDIKSILSILPHRFPFLLIDKVLELIPGEFITAIKNVTMNEPFFTGHFPENPVMPGVMILEALGQASGLLAFKSLIDQYDYQSKQKIILFAGIDEARFKRIVLPGDQLVLKSKLLKVKNDIWKCEAQALVDDHVVCSAILLGAIKEVST